VNTTETFSEHYCQTRYNRLGW